MLVGWWQETRLDRWAKRDQGAPVGHAEEFARWEVDKFSFRNAEFELQMGHVWRVTENGRSEPQGWWRPESYPYFHLCL